MATRLILMTFRRRRNFESLNHRFNTMTRFSCGIHNVIVRNASSSGNFVKLKIPLYVPLYQRDSTHTYVVPYTDFTSIVNQADVIHAELERRKYVSNIDFHTLSTKWSKFVQLESKDNYSRKTISNILKAIKQTQMCDEEKIEKCRHRINELRNNLLANRPAVCEYENSLIVPILNLPARLNPSVENRDQIILRHQSKPNFTFPVKCHTLIGQSLEQLEFVDCSPFPVFLRDKCAYVESSIMDYFESEFCSMGFEQVRNVDFAKAFVVDGCGMDVGSQLLLQDAECFADNDQQYLVGGASLPAFAAMHCKGIFESSQLPHKLVTAGRFYVKPEHNDNTLFSPSQSNCINGFVLLTKEEEENMVEDIKNILENLYSKLDLHFTIVKYGAPKLRKYESLSFGIQCFSPATNKYIEVGRLSLCGDYISKRLMILHKLNKKSVSFLSLLHIEIVNATKLVGIILENKQTADNNYVMPKSLHNHMYNDVICK